MKTAALVAAFSFLEPAVPHVVVDLDGWNRIGEILFDNIFTDMATQSRIDRAISTVERLGKTFVPVVDELAAQVNLLTTDLTRESDALRLFLERA